MKEALVQPDISVQIVDSPIPIPETNQIIIKVTYSGSNPKDWKGPSHRTEDGFNSGDDIAGTVHAVGDKVYEFKPGDRVAAFHEMGAPGGSFAEYAVAWQHTTFHIPEHVTFAEAATIPLAAMTSAIGLYLRLGIPKPWSANKPTEKQPFLVYGAASAIGAYAIQFARLSGLHPIIGVAGRGIPFAESLIDKSKGDAIIDYRNGNEAIVTGIKDALKAAGCEGIPLKYSYDGTVKDDSQKNIVAVMGPNGSNANRVGIPGASFSARTVDYPKGMTDSITYVGDVHNDDKDFGFLWFRYFARLLEDGRLKPHPYEEIAGGLNGVSEGLKNLQAGKNSGLKYVFNIADTEGIEKNVIEGAEDASAALQAATTAGFRV
ncbi:GroES-like protein [Tothia fuscella]|uniref:GroES-like protein n=1 Tax=Tothia fuscella TaxID=1048955 RepID=A0A9P4NMI9_9PEZI|nr:GroES-like protein [Tothia fuscella]